MSIKTSTLPEGGIGLIEPRGSLVGGDETVELRQAVAGFAERDYTKLLIDLSHVTYLNSTAIGVLVSAQTTFVRRNWQGEDLRHQQEYPEHLCDHEADVGV